MTKKRFLAVAIATFLSTGMIATVVTPSFAADEPTKSSATAAAAEVQATNKKAEKDFIQVSEDSLQSMRDVQNARLAIFNGLPDKAQTYIDAAETRINAAVKDSDKFAIDTKQAKRDDDYVPFTANLTVMDTFVPTPENAKHIAKANNHLHKGENKKALEVLKLGNIDVAVTTSLVPAKFAKEHIEDAAKLIRQGKYYEANLALKAVDDAIVIDTFAVDAIPKVKDKSKG